MSNQDGKFKVPAVTILKSSVNLIVQAVTRQFFKITARHVWIDPGKQHISEPLLEFHWAHRNKLRWFFLSKFINFHSGKCIKNVWKIVAMLFPPGCANNAGGNTVPFYWCVYRHAKKGLFKVTMTICLYPECFYHFIHRSTPKPTPTFDIWLYIKFIIPQIQMNTIISYMIVTPSCAG